MADWVGFCPSSGAAPHDCAYDAIWTDVSGAAHLGGVIVKGSTVVAVRNCHHSPGNNYDLGVQYVYPAQAARSFTTADKFDIAIITRDSAAAGNVTLYVVIRVFSADGTTVIGTLYNGEVNANVWATTWMNRHADGVFFQNNVNMPADGHLVVEIGCKTVYAASYDCNLIVGDVPATGPLPLNDTETNYSIYYSWIGITYGVTGYTLAAGPGSYTLSGQAADTLAARRVAADVGDYALSGQDMSVLFGRKLGADAGAYALTGQDAALLRAAMIAMEAGGYVLTGQEVALLRAARIAIDAGDYSLSGQDIALLRAARIGADGGTYVLSGQDVGLLFNRLILADAGSYVLAGQDVTLVYTPGGGAYIITADGGTYAVTGQVAGLLKANKLSLEAGAYVLTGQAINALFGRRLGADGGSYGIAGASGGVLRRWTGTAWATVNVFVRYGG